MRRIRWRYVIPVLYELLRIRYDTPFMTYVLWIDARSRRSHTDTVLQCKNCLYIIYIYKKAFYNWVRRGKKIRAQQNKINFKSICSKLTSKTINKTYLGGLIVLLGCSCERKSALAKERVLL